MRRIQSGFLIDRPMLHNTYLFSPSRCGEAPHAHSQPLQEVAHLLGLALARLLAPQPHGSTLSHECATEDGSTCFAPSQSVNANPSRNTRADA